MKKTLITLGMGACVLVAFSSCQSTDGDGYFSSEEAVPMSDFGDMVVNDGEIPPWLLEDSSGTPQVDAGATTHRRENFVIPEPGESIADIGGSASTRQNQDLAQNDVEIETNPADIVVDHPADAPGTNPVIAPATTTPAEVKPAPEKKPIATTTRKPGGTKKTGTQKVKRVTEPTLVTYKVKKGDNLSEIARRSGTTVAAIRKASGLKGDTIYAGTTIKVPFTPKGYKADAKKGGSTKATSYTVKKGDTISGIAAKNGVSTAALLKANKMSDAQAKRIRPGQKLTIPGKAAKSTKGKSSKGSKSTRKGKKKAKR